MTAGWQSGADAFVCQPAAGRYPGKTLAAARIGCSAIIKGFPSCLRGVSARMALRLSRYFGASPELWSGLPQDYELDLARDAEAAKIEKEVLPRAS